MQVKRVEEDRELRNARQRGVDRGWAMEKRAVKEGKGSRDWTPEQQKQIINKGSVPNFEGHHMRSISYGKTREEQLAIAENGNDIQFLEKSNDINKHIKAHNGDYKNATNGYYDEKTGETRSFGDGQPIAPERKPLSNPIMGKQNYQCEQNEQRDKYGVKIDDQAAADQSREQEQTATRTDH